MADRTTLALPIDVARQMDHTVTQTQLTNDTFQGTPDDRDMLQSYIEDAEGEFREISGGTIGVRRKGTQGRRETFEQATYKLSGHKITKGTFTGTWTDYLPDEAQIMLEHQSILPFDSAAGDAIYLYQGLAESGGAWKDVTDQQGDMWQILDHVTGRFVFSPFEVANVVVTGRPTAFGTVPEFLKRIRFAISYRYGGLGGDRALAGATTLSGSGQVIDASATPATLSVENAALLTEAGELSGTIVLKVGTEYLRATVDVPNDTLNVVERGIRGTNATAHDGGARVQYTPPSVRKAVASRAGMELIQSGRYSAFMPDSEDAIDKGDMMDRLQQTWEVLTGRGG